MNSKEECPICLEIFTNPKHEIVTDCNHRYHRKCIIKWKNGRQCPVCMRSISIKNLARYGKKKKQSVENTAGIPEEPRGAASEATSGPSKRKEAPESSLRRSSRIKADSSGGKSQGLKGTRTSNYEEEELKYVPDWDVYRTDHPSDPLVAQNLAEGVVLPSMEVELAEMPTDFVFMSGIMHSVKALNCFSTSFRRITDTSKSEDALQAKLVEKDSIISGLKEKLESAEARASTLESRIERVVTFEAQERAKVLRISKMNMAQKDALISELTKENKLNQTRAMAAEAALEKIKNEVEFKIVEASNKAVEEFKSSEQYQNEKMEYAFSSFNDIYSSMKKRAG